MKCNGGARGGWSMKSAGRGEGGGTGAAAFTELGGGGGAGGMKCVFGARGDR